MKGPSNDADAVRPAERTAACFRPRPPDSRGSEERLETAERYESNFRTATGNGRERSRSKYRRNPSGPPSKANARKNTKQLPNERQNARNRERIGTAPTGRPHRKSAPLARATGAGKPSRSERRSQQPSGSPGRRFRFVGPPGASDGVYRREDIRTHRTVADTGQHPQRGRDPRPKRATTPVYS